MKVVASTLRQMEEELRAGEISNAEQLLKKDLSNFLLRKKKRRW